MGCHAAYSTLYRSESSRWPRHLPVRSAPLLALLPRTVLWIPTVWWLDSLHWALYIPCHRVLRISGHSQGFRHPDSLCFASQVKYRGFGPTWVRGCQMSPKKGSAHDMYTFIFENLYTSFDIPSVTHVSLRFFFVSNSLKLISKIS